MVGSSLGSISGKFHTTSKDYFSRNTVSARSTNMPALTRAGDAIEHDAEKEKQAQERTRKKLLFLQTAGGVG